MGGRVDGRPTCMYVRSFDDSGWTLMQTDNCFTAESSQPDRLNAERKWAV